MNARRIAVWVLGPIGSGKSTLLARSLPDYFQLVDQDAGLERALIAEQIPADTRTHDAGQSARFADLRKAVSEQLWAQVPAWRSAGIPLAFETTGDKPQLLRIEVELNRAAGYLNLGIGMRCSLAACLERNRRRARVLPEGIVEQSWQAFENHRELKSYAAIFGAKAFETTSRMDACELATWLRAERENWSTTEIAESWTGLFQQ